MSLDEYKLSCELLGHSLDVRSVNHGSDFIASGSRDKTTKIWKKDLDCNSYNEELTLKDHTNFVSVVVVLEDEKWICTGSNDNTVCIYRFDEITPFTTLKGHTSTVCAISKGLRSKSIITGSWDKTARVWDLVIGTNSIITLEGHEAAVWSVTTLKSERYVTGSADKNIYIWNRNGEKIRVLKGHTDCVRAVIGLIDGTLLSCGNDAVIRYWNEEGDCVKELYGHENYIYCLSLNKSLGNDVFVTGGEDSSIRMWSVSKGQLGTHVLPAQSVWSVTCLDNGDIVTGTSDGVVRVYTKDAVRFASNDILAAYECAIETRKKESVKELGGYKVNELPGPESLLQAGTEGQTRIVRHADGKVFCYQWTLNEWKCLGDVVGASGGTQQSSGKTLYEGKEYDFVFSVDISDTEPPIKLPYNIGEDPWSASQKFIHKNNLPQVYLEQVANFIIKNSNSAPVVAPNTGIADPFTGGSRYIPGLDNAFGAESGNVDPFTGASSYTTQANSNFNTQRNTTDNGMNLDPFTGGSSYSSGNKAIDVKKIKHFPTQAYLTLDTCDATKILEKLKDFNTKARDSNAKVTEDILEGVIKLTDTNPIPNTLSIDALKHLLKWPKEILFPVLDVARLAVREPTICKQIGTIDFIALLIENISYPPANQLMSIRCLANMMIHGWGRGLIEARLDEIINSLDVIMKGNSNLQVAIATLYLNLTISQIELASSDLCSKLASAIYKFLQWSNDVEALYRIYKGLGNLSCTPYSPIVLAQLNSMSTIVEQLKNNTTAALPPGYQKLNECAQDLYALL